jgi:4-hydroxybenzoate polyprenyltransferase
MSKESSLLLFFKLLRPHQWSKNTLLFVPLLATHQISDGFSLKKLVVGFFAFSLCASTVYIINDLIDLDHDRKHPIKKHRPFAAGEISPRAGAALVPMFLTLSALLAFWVRMEFLLILSAYFLVTCAYSLWLKRISPVDCTTLAILYTLRIVAGATAVKVPLSYWLLTFSFFIFLSLANLKRYADLQLQSSLGKTNLDGLGYTYSDAALVRTIGICSGFTASLVLALYLQGETVVILYSRPEFIWITVPLILLWINWLWVKAERGQLQVDPLDFALRDKASIFLGIVILSCFFLASNRISF